ncbi:threonine--tRNA ligase [bacterium]|nr:threonine--tRNA ligase [bacterium]
MMDEKLHAMRHSAAHVLAAAIQKLYPEAQFGVGPVIDNGFYYDVRTDQPLTESDLKQVEKEMRNIIRRNLPMKREEWSIDRAIDYFKEHKQPYKVELLQDLQQHGTTKLKDFKSEDLGLGNSDEKITTITIYKTGDFVDLCKGPHADSTGEVGAFKLNKLAGAYWRGDEKRDQLQRIYGLGFETQAQLDEYLQELEDVAKRDHRKLGQELDLFTFSDLVGPGLPLYTPRGTLVMESLKDALRQIGQKYGMQFVSIPHIAKRDLYEVSGHAAKFGNELFEVHSHFVQDFVMKPVNCPHHTQIYAARPRSYRDLPIRMAEMTMQYRDEKPGEIGGLTRTRGFTVDDGHVFCRVDQIQEEVKVLVRIIKEFYSGFGLWGKHWVSLSLRDPNNMDGYVGELSDWEEAERMLADLAREEALDAKPMPGEAAIYGPKLDFMFVDALGRERQLATIQLDFAMPKRFGLTYVDQSGAEQTPVMIHRAILGSFERFMAIIIEHYAGAFPVWLAPEQVRVLPVSEKYVEYGRTAFETLRSAGVRVEIDDTNESLGKRIRNAELFKVPYSLVVGEREAENSTVAVRKYGEGDQGVMKLDEFVAKITTEIKERTV